MNAVKDPATEPSLARRLGPFDATMIVMGGIIGAGIFVNPLESGLAATLPPGLHSALLAGANNGNGIGVVEVYDRSTLQGVNPDT